VPSAAARQGGYLTTAEELSVRLAQDEGVSGPNSQALNDLLAYADGALDDEPDPVEHLRIEGNEGDFSRDGNRAYALALAHAATGDPRYAERAHDFVMSWVETMRSTRDTCQDSGACHTSLIISRQAPAFVFAAALLEEAGMFSPDDRRALESWLRDVILPVASRRINNWGDAGLFTEVVVTDYLGDQEGFEQALERWCELVDLVDPNGAIPEETRRGSSGLQYTQEALTYKVAVATIAERRGIDLWSYEGKRGGTLKEAVDYLAYYWSRPEEWPFDDDVEVPNAGPMWELAYAQWPEPAYEPIILERRPYGERGNSAIRWTTLTNGRPLGQRQ
jgi:hypothetical protein